MKEVVVGGRAIAALHVGGALMGTNVPIRQMWISSVPGAEREEGLWAS